MKREITTRTLYAAETSAKAESKSKQTVYYVQKSPDGYTATNELDYDKEFVCLYDKGVISYNLTKGV